MSIQDFSLRRFVTGHKPPSDAKEKSSSRISLLRCLRTSCSGMVGKSENKNTGEHTSDSKRKAVRRMLPSFFARYSACWISPSGSRTSCGPVFSACYTACWISPSGSRVSCEPVFLPVIRPAGAASNSVRHFYVRRVISMTPAAGYPEWSPVGIPVRV